MRNLRRKSKKSRSTEILTRRLCDWRPAYELESVLIIISSMIVIAFEALEGAEWLFVVLLLLFAICVKRGLEAYSVVLRRILLQGVDLQFMNFQQLCEIVKTTCLNKKKSAKKEDVSLAARWNRELKKSRRSISFDADEMGGSVSALWLGKGFRWKSEHAQALYELDDVDIEALRVDDRVRRLFNAPSPLKCTQVGSGVIHGVGIDDEVDFVKELSSLGGGTLIVGTTQAGKGVALTHLITQSILRNEPVIVIDPKSSKRLRKSIRQACRHAGRRAPYEFHPAFPTEGVRLDVLGAWTRQTELATRIAAVLPEENGAFTSFAWSAVNTTVQGLFYVEERPTLLSLRLVLEKGIDNLLKRALKKCLRETLDLQYEEALREIPEEKLNFTNYCKDDELLRQVFLFESLIEGGRVSSKTNVASTINSMIQVFRHNREHYAKITASLQPILAQLTTGTLSNAISPDPNDPNDQRPIVTLEKVIESNDVLYVGLDALPDRVVASALGSILLADLSAYAGKRYNLGLSGATVKRISLYVDETACVINSSMIELLNKGMEAGIHVTAAMQTIADMSHRLGSADAARMALGNFNNMIALRSKDKETQMFICESFGETTLWTTSASVSSVSDGNVQQFRSGVSRSLCQKRAPLVNESALGRLPNCEFFASVAGGEIWKARFPILRDEE